MYGHLKEAEDRVDEYNTKKEKTNFKTFLELKKKKICTNLNYENVKWDTDLNKLVIRLNVTPYNGSAPDYSLCLPRNWFTKSYDELEKTGITNVTEATRKSEKDYYLQEDIDNFNNERNSEDPVEEQELEDIPKQSGIVSRFKVGKYTIRFSKSLYEKIQKYLYDNKTDNDDDDVTSISSYNQLDVREIPYYEKLKLIKKKDGV